MKIKYLLPMVLALIFSMAAPVSATDEEARIHLIHGIPGVDVDVEVAGETVVDNFKFGDTSDLSEFSGQTLKDLKVKAAGTDTVAIDAGDTDLPASGNFTVIAHLSEAGDPTLSVFENSTAKVKAGEGRLTVRHTASAPAVDILANDEVAFANVANGEAGSADLSAGTISAKVVPTGETSPVVIGPSDIEVKEGESLVVYAVGSLEGESLTVLTESVKGIHSTPKAVHTGTSPIASDNNTPWVIVLGAATSLVLVAGSFRRVSRVKA